MILTQNVLQAAMGRAHAMGFALNEQMTASILVAASEAAGESVGASDEHTRDILVTDKINEIMATMNTIGQKVALMDKYLQNSVMPMVDSWLDPSYARSALPDGRPEEV